MMNSLRWSGTRLCNTISRSFKSAAGGPRASVGGSPVSAAAAAEATPPPPTWEQLRNHALVCAVPMVGFGFMDNTVMIHAGNAIDLTLGVTFGLSTLTAACMGQMCSDVAGLCFGDTVEAVVGKNLKPPAGPALTSVQRKLRLVRNVGLAGQCVGVVFGCALGMVNLLFIDTGLSSQLKGLHGVNVGDFTIELSNEEMEDEETRITLVGPDRPGLLSSASSSVAALGANITSATVETARGGQGVGSLRLTFHVTHDGAQIPASDFKMWGDAVMDSCQSPAALLINANADLQAENLELHAQVEKDEAMIAAEDIEIRSLQKKIEEDEAVISETRKRLEKLEKMQKGEVKK